MASLIAYHVVIVTRSLCAALFQPAHLTCRRFTRTTRFWKAFGTTLTTAGRSTARPRSVLLKPKGRCRNLQGCASLLSAQSSVGAHACKCGGRPAVSIAFYGATPAKICVGGGEDVMLGTQHSIAGLFSCPWLHNDDTHSAEE